MVDYLKLHVTDLDNNSFFVELSLDKDNDTYHVRKGEGKGGLYVSWVEPRYDAEPGIAEGIVGNAAFFSSVFEPLLKELNKGPRKYPADYDNGNPFMGSPRDDFGLDYRLEGRVNTHHIIGKVTAMPEPVVTMMNVFFNMGLLEERN